MNIKPDKREFPKNPSFPSNHNDSFDSSVIYLPIPNAVGEGLTFKQIGAIQLSEIRIKTGYLFKLVEFLGSSLDDGTINQTDCGVFLQIIGETGCAFNEAHERIEMNLDNYTGVEGGTE